jgi:hypothetical protein
MSCYAICSNISHATGVWALRHGSDVFREQRGVASAIRTSLNRPAEADERGGGGLPD